MSEKVQAELLALTKLKPKPGESAAEFTRRVHKKVETITDADGDKWESMTPEAQAWFNDNSVLIENKQPLNVLDIPEEEAKEEAAEPEPQEDEPSADEPAEEADVEGAGEEQETVVAKSVKSKANGKKPVAAKKTAAKKEAAPKKVVAAKPEKAPAKAKASKPKSDAKRGRTPLFSDQGKIKIVAKDNPHREGTIRDKAFKKLKSGMTVAEAVKAGVSRSQVWSQWKRGTISVS